MSIQRFFDRSIIVKRQRTVSGDKINVQATATVEGHLQSGLDETARQVLGILTERAWRAWFPLDTDIQEGDILRDENSVEYLVQEVTKKDYGINQHLEVILLESDDDE